MLVIYPLAKQINQGERMRKTFSLVAAATLMSGIAFAKDVKIGVILPLTGPIAAFGQTSKE